MKETLPPNIALRSLHIQRQELRKLHPSNDVWGFYNSSLEEYQIAFSPVLGQTKIQNLIADTKDPVVVDLMAPTGTLRDLFSVIPEGNKKGISLSLCDLRSGRQKQKDKELGITQVTGDVTDSKTWSDLEKELNGRKANLIMERAVEGLDKLPVHAVFYASVLQKMWNMLDDEGVMLLQIPFLHTLSKAGIDIKAWVDTLGENEIEVRIDGYSEPTGVMFMQKSLSAPKNLPFPNNHHLIPRQ
jgi:hypothetical protein